MAKGNGGNSKGVGLSSIHVIGDTKLIADCNRAMVHLQQTEIPAGKAGKIVLQRAQSLVPKRTGALANSITADTKGNVSSPLIYAPIIHYGWRDRGIEGVPFLWDAAQQSEPQWLTFFEEFTEEALELMAWR